MGPTSNFPSPTFCLHSDEKNMKFSFRLLQILFLLIFLNRIVRNKAAEKAKSVSHHGHGHGHGHGGHGGHGGNSGGGSNSGPVSPVSSQTASVITHGSTASTGNNQHQQQQHAMQQQQHVLPPHDSPHQRPGSYSINGILGIPQTDPNGNIKRKRDDHGKSRPIHYNIVSYWPKNKQENV